MKWERTMLFKYFTLPNSEERNEIRNKYPILNKLQILISPKINPRNPFDVLITDIESKHWSSVLYFKLGEVRLTYMVLKYYYDKGIPDDNWFESPGKNGMSMGFFPDFNDEHYYIHYFFNFYTDVFYHKIFSAWNDIIYHLINVVFKLNIKPGGGFNKAIKKGIETKELDLYNILNGTETDHIFEKARDFRNNMTHNHPPYRIDSGVKRAGNTVSLGKGNYIPSKEIMDNIDKLLELIVNALNEIKDYLEQ